MVKMTHLSATVEAASSSPLAAADSSSSNNKSDKEKEKDKDRDRDRDRDKVNGSTGHQPAPSANPFSALVDWFCVTQCQQC